MAKEPHNPELRAVLLEIVENQLRDGTPPETRTTLERLLRDGFTRDEAVDLIACAVCQEVFDVMKRRETYQEVRYIAALRELPRLPWDEG